MKTNTTMPKGINEQPSRAMRRGTKGMHASYTTVKPSASRSTRSAAAAPSPASSTKPTLAKQPTPPPSSVSSGNKSAEEAPRDLRPASTPAQVTTPAPGVSGIDRPGVPRDGGSPKPAYATPGELLKAAAAMGEEEARELLLRELRLRGLREVDLELIKPDCKLCLTGRGSQLAFWIRRFREAAEQWSNLPFDNIGDMSRSWEQALTAAQGGYTRSAIRSIQFHNWRFGNQADHRKWRFWMLGNVWRELEVEPNLPVDIAGWLRTLLKQPKGEQEVLLRLWQADFDRWEFDKITARNLCPDRIAKKDKTTPKGTAADPTLTLIQRLQDEMRRNVERHSQSTDNTR